MPTSANLFSPEAAPFSAPTRETRGFRADEGDTRISRGFIGAAVFACSFQILWFGSKCIHQIDYDGMAYTGIARHLRQSEYFASINAFRSPLLCWIIALLSFVRADFVAIGKLCSVGSYVLCLGLLYTFTRSLWRSATVASIATLLFVLGRGLCVSAVGSVTPDFLFAALVLVYFLVLLRCLRGEQGKNWLYLGTVHGVAYLAKAFALPWLAVCTLVAAVLSEGSWKKRTARVALATVVPVVISAGWATVLHSKYGAVTTGTQMRANLLQWTVGAYRDRPDPTYLVLSDTTQTVDEYLVDDPMPPGSWRWAYPLRLTQILPKLIRAERRNVPSVIKEIIIVATPGGVVAFLTATWVLARKRRQYPLAARISIVIAMGAVSLVLAYSMLVFDTRYLFPLTPLLLAVAARVFVPEPGGDPIAGRTIRMLSVVLAVLGVIASLVYSSSPFRQITRDFQASCYDVGRDLKNHAGSTVVSIGSGPYPEHGVGWEAGYKAAYFGRYRLIGATLTLPATDRFTDLLTDLGKASPDAVLLWGRPDDTHYRLLFRELGSEYKNDSERPIVDPVLGRVGTVFFSVH